jgi:hypothetical protein
MAGYRENAYVQNLINRVGEACKKRNWKKDWSNGGCYIHLEVSEFIESLRGKGGVPVKEAADVLITLFAVMAHYGIKAEDLLDSLEEITSGIEKGTIGEKVEVL